MDCSRRHRAWRGGCTASTINICLKQGSCNFLQALQRQVCAPSVSSWRPDLFSMRGEGRRERRDVRHGASIAVKSGSRLPEVPHTAADQCEEVVVWSISRASKVIFSWASRTNPRFAAARRDRVLVYASVGHRIEQ
jgi:hypothetical protein